MPDRYYPKTSGIEEGLLREAIGPGFLGYLVMVQVKGMGRTSWEQII
jgi:hypothetical protein